MSLARESADRLAAAKLWLVTSEPGCGDLPYLSTAVYAFIPVPSTRVAAMTVDVQWRLYVNETWLLATDVPQIGLELAHLALHLLADHAGRATDVGVTRRTTAAWVKAADATIAELLDDESAPGAAGAPSAGRGDHGLAPPAALGLRPGRSAEEYFAGLSGLPAAEASGADDEGPDDLDGGADDACGSGCDGHARSYEVIDDSVGGLDEHAARSIRERVAVEYRGRVTARGTLPGEWDRWVSRVLEPVVDWRQVLHAAVRRGIGWAAGQTDYSYARPSRRQSASPQVVLPSMRRPVPRVAVVVDTSGSVDDGLLAQALGEVDGVLRSLAVGDGNVTVLAVDAAVQAVSTVRAARDVRLAGGGGTDMELGIQAALETRPRPDLVVLLTDGETGWPHRPTPVPLVAVILGRQRAELPPTPAWAVRVECVPD
jgi:predicted metal-dependent peptidase